MHEVDLTDDWEVICDGDGYWYSSIENDWDMDTAWRDSSGNRVPCHFEGEVLLVKVKMPYHHYSPEMVFTIEGYDGSYEYKMEKGWPVIYADDDGRPGKKLSVDEPLWGINYMDRYGDSSYFLHKRVTLKRKLRKDEWFWYGLHTTSCYYMVSDRLGSERYPTRRQTETDYLATYTIFEDEPPAEQCPEVTMRNEITINCICLTVYFPCWTGPKAENYMLFVADSAVPGSILPAYAFMFQRLTWERLTPSSMEEDALGYGRKLTAEAGVGETVMENASFSRIGRTEVPVSENRMTLRNLFRIMTGPVSLKDSSKARKAMQRILTAIYSVKETVSRKIQLQRAVASSCIAGDRNRPWRQLLVRMREAAVLFTGTRGFSRGFREYRPLESRVTKEILLESRIEG